MTDKCDKDKEKGREGREPAGQVDKDKSPNRQP
jgi:hypothetical protein